ncbi:glycosyltransferase [Roseomonas haemaphysalidis]|uniref:Glycosyltransferase n=1 Tax=Roseomonas haemaphysalidis TaxID=2768162 RepID=A0ABS3KVB8_9PROT|nr:glycosyltransferase [Roseomonas haemaphysalidis]MBO1081432.1 glycosyltransferase [Roseomonas haemaphysalidis]
MQPLRVLAFSTLFPNEAQPGHGVFLEHRLSALAAQPGVQLQVVAPVPYFPLRHGRFGRYARFAQVPRGGRRNGLDVTHPRYPVVPKLGMTVAPAAMALAVLPHLRRLQAAGEDFDVIDAYYLYPDGVAAALLGRLLGKPVVLTAFGSDVSQIPAHRLPRAAIRWAMRGAEGSTAVCAALREELLRLGAAAEGMRVVLHGVDLTLFQPPQDRAALRRALGFDGPTLVSAGHLIPRKGHDFAIRAMQDLPDHTLVIVGQGPEEAALRLLAQQPGVQHRVRFAGQVPQMRLAEIFGAADVVLNCSDREGIANVLMEAMACGTAVAATPVWGSPEVITTPDAGLLLRDRSAGAIVDGVRQLAACPPDRAATRQHAARFTWDDTARQHLGVLRQAVARRNTASHTPRGTPAAKPI